MINFSIDNDIAIIEIDDGKANVFDLETSKGALDGLKQAEAKVAFPRKSGPF